MESKHSPLPWKVYADESRMWIEGHGTIFSICSMNDILSKRTANADLIVHSVNLFPRLVKALEKEHQLAWVEINNQREDPYDHTTSPCDVCNLLKEARGVNP